MFDRKTYGPPPENGEGGNGPGDGTNIGLIAGGVGLAALFLYMNRNK